MATRRSDESSGGKGKSRRTSKRQGSSRQGKGGDSQECGHNGQTPPLPTVFEDIADGLIVLDPDWRCTYINQAAATFFKTAPEQIQNKVLWETFPHLRDSQFCKESLRAASEKTFVRIEDYYEPLGRWYECRCHGTQSGLTVLLNDVTGHKKIEQVMLESRQALEMAIAGSSTGIWRIDLNPEKPGHLPDYEYLSPQLKSLIGFDSGELPNSRSAWLDRVVPEDRPGLIEALQGHADGQPETFQIDYRIRHKDGSLRWLSRQGRLYRDEFNRPVRWAGADTDVTDRKLAAEAVRRSEERLQQALEAGEVFTFEWRPATDEVVRSPNCASILGWTGDATRDTGQDYFRQVHPEDRETFVRLVSSLAPEKPAYEVTYRYVRPDDRREVVLEESGRAVFDETGTMVCLRGLTRDVTARERMEQSLRRAYEQLQTQAEELQAQHEELQAQHEELQAQQEELQTQTEELREQEQALRASERLSRDRLAEIEAIYDSAHVGLCVFDRELRYLRINERLAEINGVPASQHLGRTVRQIVPDLADAAERLAEGIFRTGEPVLNMELSGTTTAQPGVLRHWIEHWLPIKDERGQIVAINVVAHEVTERRRVGQALDRQRELLQGIIDGIPVMLVMWDPQLQRFTLNRHATEVLGWTTEDANEGDFMSKVYPDPAYRARVCEYMQSLESGWREWEVATKDGRRVNSDWANIHLSDETRIGIGVDLRERKRAERALADSERKYRTLIETSNSVILRWDRRGVIQFINERGADLLGYEPQELIGRDVTALVPQVESTGRDLSTLTQDILDHPEQYAHNPNENVRKDGSRLWIAWANRAIVDESGVVQEILAVGNDITALKEAETALRRSEDRFRLLSETASRLLTTGTPLDVVKDLCGEVMAHLDCQTFFNYVVDEKAGRLRLNACAGIAKEEAEAIEWLDYGAAVCGYVAREGERIIAEDIASHADPRTDLVASYGIKAYACHPLLAAGKVIGTLSFGTRTRTRFSDEDLSLMKTVADQVAAATERIRSHRAVRENEQRLRMALEGGKMGLWEWDLQGHQDFWDERVYELLGLDSVTRAGLETFRQHVDKRDVDAVNEQIRKSLAESDEFQVEFRLVRPGGETVWVASQGRAIRDASGAVVRMLGVLFDITPKKHMEEQLRRLNDQLEEEVQAQTEELRDTIDRLQDEVVRRVLAEGKLRKSSQMLEGFFQHTITPLAFMDRRFNFVRVNEAYARADGKTPEFFKDKNHFALYPSVENQAVFEEVVRTGRPYRAHARPFNYPDRPGQLTFWDWQLTPLQNDRGEIQYLVLNLQDVTQQQATLCELEQRARQLQKLTLELSQAEDRERRRMAEVLHDGLQQQLAAAKFHLGLLSSRARTDAAMQEIAGQLDRMLRDAIEQSRSLSHELSPAVLYQSDLGETFEWLARQIQNKHGMTVHTEVHGHVDSRSESIKAFLFRTGQEILFNAVKHAKVSEARLRLQRRDDRLWLTIADHGRGFDPRTLGRAAGFGLLSIRERVGLLGGRMKIRSVPNRGSVFLIAVPDASILEDKEQRAQDAAQKVESRSPVRPPSTAGRPAVFRVLLVDDHKVMREGLAALIAEQEDMEIVGQAGDGREAVEMARRLEPDVIIMDVAMPVMGGDEATRQIKTELPQTRVIALSMFAESGVREKMIDAGAETYLPKTGPSEDFLAAIRG